MKIIELAAENVKRITALQILPDGALIEVAGRNGQGKTSVLDAFLWAVGGKKAMQSDPVRHGEDEALIRLRLGPFKEGHLVVTRVIRKTAAGDIVTEVKVEGDDGAKFTSGQAMLDAMIGPISLDPVGFERMGAPDQFEVIKKLVPDIDFDEIAKERQALYERRADANRSAKERDAQARAIFVDPTAPADEIDVESLVAKLAGVSEHNDQVRAALAMRSDLTRKVEAIRDEAREKRDEAERLRAAADKLDDEAVEWVEKADELEKKVTALDEPGDMRATSDIEAEIRQAREINGKVSDRKRKAALVAEAAKFSKESEELTRQIEESDAHKEQAIARAELPVPNLGLADGVVTLGGVPFEQASDAERLRASIAIAMALSPALRVIRVHEGSRLDDDALRIVRDMAEERDYQVLLESVRPGTDTALIIEDGHIRGQDPSAVALMLHDTKATRSSRKKGGK